LNQPLDHICGYKIINNDQFKKILQKAGNDIYQNKESNSSSNKKKNEKICIYNRVWHLCTNDTVLFAQNVIIPFTLV